MAQVSVSVVILLVLLEEKDIHIQVNGILCILFHMLTPISQ
jgi:hypothetical protein